MTDKHREDFEAWVEHSGYVEEVHSILWEAWQAAQAQPAAVTAEVECGCGDIYPAESYEHGVIDALGHCSNCEASKPSNPKWKPSADQREVMQGALDALGAADTLCGSMTSEECPDTVHIPIREAIAALRLALAAPQAKAAEITESNYFQAAVEAMRQEDFANWDQQMPLEHYNALARVAFMVMDRYLEPKPPAPARESVQAPAGYKLVPIEPTPEMKEAIIKECDRQEESWMYQPLNMYAAILAAAPPAPARVALTDEQIDMQKPNWFNPDLRPEIIFHRGIRAAEAAHHIPAA